MNQGRSGGPRMDGERPDRLYALVDCSAFYCSCERVFDPSLEGRPVAVLSNNDGCVIARSDEVKAAGIKMGEPFFECRKRLEAIGAAIFSSNFTVYADLSARVQATLHTFPVDVEQYSIDESFLRMPTPKGSPEEVRRQVEDLARQIRERVLRWTGIPVRVSFARTKTLAKAASELARALLKAGREPCVCLYGHPGRERWLESLPVGDVWGVGRRWAPKLEALGAANAAALARLPDRLVQQRFNVVMLRTVYELRGIPCIDTADVETRKSMVRSRSFGQAVFDLPTLLQACSTHAARAAEKLRAEGLVCGEVGVFYTTGRHGNGPHRTFSWSGPLPVHSADTTEIIAHVRRAARGGFLAVDGCGRPYGYKKAGVMLNDIRPAGQEQRALFASESETSHSEEERDARSTLQGAMDLLNRRFGKGTAWIGSMGGPGRPGEEKGWGMKRERMSRRYTTRLDELPIVRA